MGSLELKKSLKWSVSRMTTWPENPWSLVPKCCVLEQGTFPFDFDEREGNRLFVQKTGDGLSHTNIAYLPRCLAQLEMLLIPNALNRGRLEIATSAIARVKEKGLTGCTENQWHNSQGEGAEFPYLMLFTKALSLNLDEREGNRLFVQKTGDPLSHQHGIFTRMFGPFTF